MAGNLKLDLAQFREVEGFTKLGITLDDATKQLVERGSRLTSLLIQKRYLPEPIANQILYLFFATEGYLNWLDASLITLFQEEFKKWFNTTCFKKPIVSSINRMELPALLVEYLSFYFAVFFKEYTDKYYSEK